MDRVGTSVRVTSDKPAARTTKGPGTRAVKYSALSSPVRLHLGCGAIRPAGWINIDGSWNGAVSRHPVLRRLVRVFGVSPGAEARWAESPVMVHDLKRRLPFP